MSGERYRRLLAYEIACGKSDCEFRRFDDSSSASETYKAAMQAGWRHRSATGHVVSIDRTDSWQLGGKG